LSSAAAEAPHDAPHHPALAHHFSDMHVQKESASLGMWLFIAQEIMFFGGLFLAYTIYRHLYPVAFEAGSHHLARFWGTLNTAVLICSSLTMAMGVHAAALGHAKQIVAWLLATIALGSVFLGVKTIEYKDKFESHLVPGPHFSAEHLKLQTKDGERALTEAEGRQAQIYFSLYFGMTGLHALHMIIGIPIIFWIAWRAWRGDFGPGYHTPVELTGLYWHFVDIIWIFLFPLLYLIPPH
jgi:cytochrome c oxidase subunit 3